MRPDLEASPPRPTGHPAGLRLAVRKRLGNFTLDASLALPGHGVSALFGVSGSGKTSLLRLIAGLDRPDEGVIQIGSRCLVDTSRGHFLPPQHRRIGVVFQEARLFPHYRVLGNLTYGMPPSAQSRFEPIVELLGIRALLERMPGTLSGGEARRVSIGRALLTDPELLLMDEPLTGLDATRKQELLHYILSLTRDLEIPIVYISHDAEEISTIANHMVLIDGGSIRASDRLDKVLNRLDLTTQLGGFDAASVLEARIASHDHDYALTCLDLGRGQSLAIPRVDIPLGARCKVWVPVRDVGLSLMPPTGTSYSNQLDAVIERIGNIQQDATTVELLLRVGHQPLRARLSRRSCDELHLAENTQVKALIHCNAFDIRHLEA